MTMRRDTHMNIEDNRGLIEHKKAFLRQKKDKLHLSLAINKYIFSPIPPLPPFKAKTYRALDLPAMAYVNESHPDLRYTDSAFQAGDEIWLKCYAGGDTGYVNMYDDNKPGYTTLVQRLGNSYVDIKDGTHVYYTTWVDST
ncbi:MAG: hypothetical protein Q9178_007960 [Gyalolechia marmorata]